MADCPEVVRSGSPVQPGQFSCEEYVGGIMPALVASRCMQQAEAWIDVSRALEGEDLQCTAAAVQQLRATLKHAEAVLVASEAELQRRKDYAAEQERARRQIDEAMATVKRDVGALGDAIFGGRALQVHSEDVGYIINSLVDEERRETARRALALATNPPNGEVPSGPALRSAIQMGHVAGLDEEELQPAYEALEAEQRRLQARQQLSRALTPCPEDRSVDAINDALQSAKLAGVANGELQAAEEAIRDGQKSSIWYDIISIIADDSAEGQCSGGVLAGLVGLPEEAQLGVEAAPEHQPCE